MKKPLLAITLLVSSTSIAQELTLGSEGKATMQRVAMAWPTSSGAGADFASGVEALESQLNTIQSELESLQLEISKLQLLWLSFQRIQQEGMLPSRLRLMTVVGYLRCC
jgi:peptidoglycan hydrolase CwlO-like protein